MMDKDTIPEGIPVHFYRSENGKEPVRDWLKGLGRPMGDGLFEVRSSLPGGRIARERKDNVS